MNIFSMNWYRINLSAGQILFYIQVISHSTFKIRTVKSIMKKLVVFFIILLFIAGAASYQLVFNSVKTITLSEKRYTWTQSPLSIAANTNFWQQFHQGNYDSIPSVLEKLTAAYLDNPNDIRTITHLAFTHMWALSEHNNNNSPSVIDHATLAQKYFGESYLMNPSDTRILSFLSSVKLVNGAISHDKGLLKVGYLNGLKAIREWENFSAFSLAYTLSRLPYTDDKFQKGLKLMRTLAEGYAKNLDPKGNATREQIAGMKLLDYSHKSKDRVFYNSWVAPHNIEGFFMAYGDMLVKNGE